MEQHDERGVWVWGVDEIDRNMIAVGGFPGLATVGDDGSGGNSRRPDGLGVPVWEPGGCAIGSGFQGVILVWPSRG